MKNKDFEKFVNELDEFTEMKKKIMDHYLKLGKTIYDPEDLK